MRKYFVNEIFRLERLMVLKRCLNNIIKLEIDKKFLLTEFNANNKILYKTTTNRRNVAGEFLNYRNTSAFIVSCGQKVRIKSESDVKNQLRFEKLFEIDAQLEHDVKMAKMCCNSINSLKNYGVDNYDFNILKSVAINEINVSYECGCFGGNMDVYFSDCENLDEFICNPELDNTFNNFIVNSKNERFRSKNELLASMCLQKCGLSYCTEPMYPDSGMRADFGVFCSLKMNAGKIEYYKKPKQVFIEITGLRNDEKYETKLQQKIQIAKKNKIPLLIIDMTDYPDENGKCITKFNFNSLCKIFTKLYFGLLKAEGNVVYPYETKKDKV